MEIRVAEPRSHFSRAARSSPKPDSISRQSNTVFVASPISMSAPRSRSATGDASKAKRSCSTCDDGLQQASLVKRNNPRRMGGAKRYPSLLEMMGFAALYPSYGFPTALLGDRRVHKALRVRAKLPHDLVVIGVLHRHRLQPIL